MTLAACVFVFVAIQFGLASPFVDDDMAKFLGFDGAKTGWAEYLRKIKLFEEDVKTNAVDY